MVNNCGALSTLLQSADMLKLGILSKQAQA